MARWIHSGADLVGPGESRRALAGDGASPGPTPALPAGVVRELVPVLAGLVLGPEKGGEE